MECGVQGAFFHTQNLVGDALDVQGDAPAVHRPPIEAVQHKKSQSSLKVVTLVSSHSVVPLDVYIRMGSS
jgi:CMP-2-keto-3-deoxyoctulosonic acid synthetase